MEGVEQITAFSFWNWGDITIVRIGEEIACAMLVEPVYLGLRQQENPAQEQGKRAVRMRDRIGEGKRGSPGAAKHDPFFNAQHFPDLLDVRDQVPGRVFLERGAGGGSSASALIKEDDTKVSRVEKTAHVRVGTATRATMKGDDRDAVYRTGIFPVKFVEVRDLDASRLSWLDMRVQLSSYGGHSVHDCFTYTKSNVR